MTTNDIDDRANLERLRRYERQSDLANRLTLGAAIGSALAAGLSFAGLIMPAAATFALGMLGGALIGAGTSVKRSENRDRESGSRSGSS